MGLERDLSILAEHYNDFAVLNYAPELISRWHYMRELLVPMWKNSGNIVEIEDYIINPRPSYLSGYNVRIISPDGINVYIFNTNLNNHIEDMYITTFDKLGKSPNLLGAKIGCFYNRLIDRTPLEDIRESLIKARENMIKIGHLSEKFEEYYHKCMNHLEPTMIKSAKARPPNMETFIFNKSSD